MELPRDSVLQLLLQNSNVNVAWAIALLSTVLDAYVVHMS
jgi:hypothetical protein